MTISTKKNCETLTENGQETRYDLDRRSVQSNKIKVERQWSFRERRCTRETRTRLEAFALVLERSHDNGFWTKAVNNCCCKSDGQPRDSTGSSRTGSVGRDAEVTNDDTGSGLGTDTLEVEPSSIRLTTDVC